jgi:hypothetical protein
MRRTGRISLSRVVAVAIGLLLLVWGAGAAPSGAQEHDDDHGEHGTTTTGPTPSSTTTTATTAPPAGTQTRTVRYGPIALQPAAPNPDGSHGMIHVPGFNPNAEKPCTNCYITKIVPDLVRADGTRAGYSNDLGLHHMVLVNRDTGRTDATCPLYGSQRFFAAGDERTTTALPPGYGYHISPASSWSLVWELMSMSTESETVYLQVTYSYVPDTTHLTDTEPIWLDVDQCGDSEVSIPTGPSEQTYTWTVNQPGKIVTIHGHLHDHGVNIEIRNDTTGQVICNSVAGYGESPLYVDHHGEEHISSMTHCGGEGATQAVATVASGQRVTMTSHYDSPEAVDDAMAIVHGFIAVDGGNGGDPQCTRATNQAHVAAGRATAFLIFAWAKGSNEYLGLIWDTTALRQASTGTWVRASAC